MQQRLTTDEMVQIIRTGLPKPVRPKKVAVVGAGMSGLVAASLLKHAGHTVDLIEADNRIGGRVFTMRKPFSDGLYMDMGAMRIPNQYRLTAEYVKKFRLPVNPFINGTQEDVILANNVKTRMKQFKQNPDILKFPLLPDEKGQTAAQLVWWSCSPAFEYLKQNPSGLSQFTDYSMQTFLSDNPFGRSLSRGAIDEIQVLLDIEAFSELSFVDIFTTVLLPIFLFSENAFYEITGGNDRLPYAFLPYLQDDLYLSHEMVKITQLEASVTIHAKHSLTGHISAFTADEAIITTPFNPLQLVEIEPYHSLSYEKWRAIRELHASSSVKIGIEFKNRFWEKTGHRGGKIVTDLPIRFAYFPSHGIGETGPAVMLASYTWEDDAMPWESLSETARINQALENLAAVFGNVVYREFVTGASYSWLEHPYSAGAFTVLKPGQSTLLKEILIASEGRLHFAGEHTSHYPGWIEGAIESGIREAWRVNGQRRH